MSDLRNSRLSRRAFLTGVGATAFGAALAACASPAAPSAAPAASGGEAAPAGSAEKVAIHAHMVQKQDVSDWIQAGLDQDIDGFVTNNPNLEVVLETVPGWTPEYIPKILSLTAAGTLGDLVWFPPRHRSHIAWGTQYGIVTDLHPMAESAGYDIDANFFPGAVAVNTHEGKMYWMSFISEPIVPVIAYNKTKIAEMGLPELTDEMTFAELADWAAQAKTDDVYGYYRADRGGVFSGGPYLRQWGVEPTDETGTKATFLDTREQFVQALQYDYDLLQRGLSPTPAAGAVNAPELFGAQKVLAVDIWPFRIQIYPATFTDFETGFALTPKVNAADERRSMLNEHVFGITTSSKATDAAFTFLTWICGHEMNVQAVVQGQKGPIARADFWADDRVYEAVPTYEKLRPIMESIEPDYLVANFRGDEFDTAYQAVLDAMELGDKTPEVAADEMQTACQAVLDKEPA